MKKIIIKNVLEHQTEYRRPDMPFDMTIEGLDDMQVSDGDHTMDELYEHRYQLFIALCKILEDEYSGCSFNQVWRAQYHHDGSQYDGWFIMGIETDKGKQVSYHLPMSKWDETDFATDLGRAPEWDGHTSKDVLERLKKI